jgi:hypothetical protein
MKKALVAMMVLFVGVAFAGKKPTTVKVEVPTGTENRAFESHGSGLIGAAVGSRTRDVVFMLNVVVNEQNARLKCYENHGGCSPLGPGTYDGELKGEDLWISFTKPLTNQVVRDHWKVVGSW